MADPFGIYYDAQTGGYIDPATGEHLDGGKLAQLRYLKQYHDAAGGALDTPGGGVMTQQDFGAFQANPFRGMGGGRGGGAGMENLPQNPFELAAWMQLRNPGSGGVPYGDGGRSYWGSSSGLTDLFNQGATSIRTPHGTVTTAGGPYAQLQQAAVDTAPARAARDIAEIQASVDLDKNRGQREFASQLIKSLFGAGMGGGRPQGITTDYGAGVSMPRAPAHVNVNRFRPRSNTAALFG